MRDAERIRSFRDLADYVEAHKDRIRVKHGDDLVMLTDLPAPVAITYALSIVRSGSVPLVED